MFPKYQRYPLLWMAMLFFVVTNFTFGQPSSTNEIDSLKLQLLKLQQDFKALERRVQALEGLKKIAVPPTPNAQAFNIETAAPNTKNKPYPLSTSSIPISWSHTGKMVLQVYLDENPIYNREHSSGDVIKLLSNKVVELKIWIPGSSIPYKQDVWVSTPPK